MRQFDNNSWKQIVNSVNLDDEFDDIYEEHAKREHRQRIKDKDRHALKESQKGNF